MSGSAYAAVVEIVMEPGSDPAHRHGVLTRDGGPPTVRAGIHEVELEDPRTQSHE